MNFKGLTITFDVDNNVQQKTGNVVLHYIFVLKPTIMLFRLNLLIHKMHERLGPD